MEISKNIDLEIYFDIFCDGVLIALKHCTPARELFLLFQSRAFLSPVLPGLQFSRGAGKHLSQDK